VQRCIEDIDEQDAFEQAEADLGESIRQGSLFAYFARAKLYEAVGRASQATADLKAFLAKGGGQAYGNLPQVRAALRQLEQ
jgi:hypothetical protein